MAKTKKGSDFIPDKVVIGLAKKLKLEAVIVMGITPTGIAVHSHGVCLTNAKHFLSAMDNTKVNIMKATLSSLKILGD